MDTPSIDWDQLGKHKKIAKGTILQTKGSWLAKAYFVKSGLLRSYTIDENGKIHIFMFAPEGWLVADIKSHAFAEPSELFIDALEDSEIVEINSINFRRLGEDLKLLNNELEKLMRRLAILQERVIMLMSATAQQRYEHFLKTYPQLTQRVPLKMIASYLGITPEALSTIRRKMIS